MILTPTYGIKFINSNISVIINGEEKSETHLNFFIGNDPEKWVRDVRGFHTILYKEIYRNIDLVIRIVEDEIKKEFHVHPGGDHSDIILQYTGINKLKISRSGHLKILTQTKKIIEDIPYTYQKIHGKNQRIQARYQIIDSNMVKFNVGEYQKDNDLIIDPELEYCTFLGGSDEEMGWVIASDAHGNAFVAGETYKGDYPTTADAYDSLFSGEGDIFVSKIDPSGSRLIYSTFIGGSNDHPNGVEGADGIAVDESGQVYLTGWTSAWDFPTTQGAFDRSFNGGGDEYYIDAFITKLDSEGANLIYSTYLGGNMDEWGNGLSVDKGGCAYIVGVTYSLNFPTTLGVIDTTHNGGVGDAFVTKFNPTGTDLVYSTLLGGSQWEEGGSITLDDDGNAVISGYTESNDFPTTPGSFDSGYNGGDGDGFISKLDPNGSHLLFSTFLGGSSQDSCDDDGGDGIQLDRFGNIYLVGETDSDDFPVTSDAFDASSNGKSDVFVTILDPSGSEILYSTYLGGSKEEKGNGIAIDQSGGIYLVGDTKSKDFPVTANAFEKNLSGRQDVFAAKLISSGSNLVYSTYLGGSRDDESDGIALSNGFGLFITGWTRSDDFPVTQHAYDTSHNGMEDVYIAKFILDSPIISGTVKTPEEEGIKSVLLSFSQKGGNTMTDENGYYSQSVAPGWSGSVIPSKIQMSFEPKKRHFVNVRTNISDQNFLGQYEIFSDKPPLNFNGTKIENRSLSQIEYIIILNWQAHPEHRDLIGYRIYRTDGPIETLLVELKADRFQYFHRNIKKEKKYQYALTAVNTQGKESLPAYIEVW